MTLARIRILLHLAVMILQKNTIKAVSLILLWGLFAIPLQVFAGAYDDFRKAQQSGNDTAYWQSARRLADEMWLSGQKDEAFQMLSTIDAHTRHLDDRMVLAQDRQVRNIAVYSLFPVLIAFSFFAFVFYRNRREMHFRRRQAEVEMKALRAQMNPHFIFNCMNSILKFMKENNPEMAGDYLIRFSKLIRAVLENSNHKEVTLEDDLSALELYIQMEQLRLQNRFSYSINADQKVEREDVYIPPLILQPFVENAIWHGLSGKESDGRLTLEYQRNGDFIFYSVTDNGNAETTSATEKPNNLPGVKKTSMGTSITRERIELLNRTNENKATVEEQILTDAQGRYCGRKVTVILPYKAG